MSAVFCDTSALYALLDRSDANASAAGAIWGRLLDDSGTILTTNYVMVETVSLVAARLGIKAVSALRDLMGPFVTVHWIDRALHLAALEQLLALNRRKLSLVDCSSFAFMRHHAVGKAFSFDHHFSEFGFELL
jgi:predicted nucleic acid-binding protein